MKIAVVWNHDSRLLDCSFRFEQYLAGLRALGHEPVMVCARASAAGFEAPFHLAGDAAELREPRFWREVGADVAVIVTWHRMADVLEAMRAAGTRVAAIADSDGRVGVAVFPAFALERFLAYSDGWAQRARAVKHWLGRLGRDRRRPSAEDSEAVRSTRASHAVAFGHGEGVRLFRSFLAWHGEEALASRLVEVPFTIGASFLSCPVLAAKDDRVVAVGRWGDPQKNAPLLARALDLFLAARPATEVVVYGAGGERTFAPLAARRPRLEYLGVAPQEAVAQTLSRSRALVFSSRWEGCPHAGLEALALGATLVGPPLPSLASWTADGRCGRVARRPRPRDLAAALAREMASWDAGERDPRAIAEHWRGQVAPEAVCRRLLAAVR
ncbi:MAG TPA: glycosyltransferase [Thermoanaerobaculia bacterium]